MPCQSAACLKRIVYFHAGEAPEILIGGVDCRTVALGDGRDLSVDNQIAAGGACRFEQVDYLLSMIGLFSK